MLGGNVVDHLQDYPPAAVIEAGVASTEPTAQQFTIFAPENGALQTILPGYTGPVKSLEVCCPPLPSTRCVCSSEI